jgi:hypothetical protein
LEGFFREHPKVPNVAVNITLSVSQERFPGMVFFVAFLLLRESLVVFRLLGLQPFQGGPSFLELLAQGFVVLLRLCNSINRGNVDLVIAYRGTWPSMTRLRS